MSVLSCLREGLIEIRAHAFRSFLTMLGVILGVASLISTFALTAGWAEGSKQVLQQIGGLEKINVVDSPVPPHQEQIREMSPGRTYADVEAIRRRAPLIARVSPELEEGQMRVSHGKLNIGARVLGVEPDFFAIERHEQGLGRLLCDLDTEHFHRVCVLGQTVAAELFEDPVIAANPVGQQISLNGQMFQVVGMFPLYETEDQKRARASGVSVTGGSGRAGVPMRRRWDPMWAKNNTIVIPLTTFRECFRSWSTVESRDGGGMSEGFRDGKLSRINLQVADLGQFREAVEQAKAALMQTHRGIEDFTLDTREGWFESMERQGRAAELSGAMIAGISLIVGGIGIANTMLASIAQRIREIGIRRAVGARARDVFVQILIESSLLATVGALLGLLLAPVFVQALIMVAPSENAPILQMKPMLFSVLAALAVGVVSGIYPAVAAARLSPIQALRYE